MAETCTPHNLPDREASHQNAAFLFNLASNPVRLRILGSLTDGAATVQQLAEKLGRERRLVNQYLQTLVRADLVRSDREGRQLVYTPTESGLRLLQASRILAGSPGARPSDLADDPGSDRSGFRPPSPGRAGTLAQAVERLRAFADPVRLRLLNLLAGSHEVCVCHLYEALSLPQSTVSRHLTTLRQAGLIVGRRHGTWVYYRLALPARDLDHLMSRQLGQGLFSSDVLEDDRRRLAGFSACDGRVTATPGLEGQTLSRDPSFEPDWP